MQGRSSIDDEITETDSPQRIHLMDAYTLHGDSRLGPFLIRANLKDVSAWGIVDPRGDGRDHVGEMTSAKEGVDASRARRKAAKQKAANKLKKN
jgi:hypothetical protein